MDTGDDDAAAREEVCFPDVRSHAGKGHAIKAVLQFCKQVSPTGGYTAMIERLGEVLQAHGFLSGDRPADVRLATQLGASIFCRDDDALEETLVAAAESSAAQAEAEAAEKERPQEEAAPARGGESPALSPVAEDGAAAAEAGPEPPRPAHAKAKASRVPRWKGHRRTQSFLQRQALQEERVFTFINETTADDSAKFTGVMDEMSQIMSSMPCFDGAAAGPASPGSDSTASVESAGAAPEEPAAAAAAAEPAPESAPSPSPAPSPTASEAEERAIGAELAQTIRAEANTARLDDYSAGLEHYNDFFASIDGAAPSGQDEAPEGLPAVPEDVLRCAHLTDEQRRSIDMAATSANTSLVAEMEELQRATAEIELAAAAEEEDVAAANDDGDEEDEDEFADEFDDEFEADAGFGKFQLPQHHRSASSDKMFGHMTPNAKRLSSAVDCSLAFAKYLAAKKAAAALPSTAEEAGESSGEAAADAEAEAEAKKRAEKRRLIVGELLSTERTYVACLGQLVRLFAAPLREPATQARLGVSASQVHGVFSNVEIIHSLHQQFLGRLEACEAGGESLFDEVLRSADFLKIYTEYVSKYDTQTIRLLGELQRNKRFAAFVARVEGAPDPAGDARAVQSLQSYLIMPVQRIPRYEMLLTACKRLTPATAADYSSVCASAHKVSAIASHVNENKRHIENMDRVLCIQRTVKGIDRHLMQPHRRFVRQGTLRMLEPKRREYTFFLFNDICMWASAANNFKGVVELVSARVEDGEDTTLRVVVESRAARSAWTPARTVMQFGSAADKASWMADVQRGIEWSLAAQEERELAVRTAALRRSESSRRANDPHAKENGASWFHNAPRAAEASPAPSKRNTAILIGALSPPPR